MEILAAYDLVESFRGAGELTNTSHHTVARLVRARDAGEDAFESSRRPKVTDVWLPHIEQWMRDSDGNVRGDVVHRKLVTMGYAGSERSTRRAVSQVRADYRKGKLRVHRPWVTEPGGWVQYDFGDGPFIDGVKTVLFIAWVAWSRFRVVIPLRDKTLPSVFGALDRTFRILGGVPTYVLTDNEKTVTTMHIAGVPVRNEQVVAFARHYGVTVLTCTAADPATKGGVEASVKLAKADLVPKDTNLLPQYGSFAALEAACEAFMDEVNNREHRATRRLPAQMLTEEQDALHTVPVTAHTIGLGLGRKVGANTPMVTFEHSQYSVPAHLLGQEVFVRLHGVGAGTTVVIMHVGPRGPVEVARHQVTSPGSPAINDEHFPDHKEKIPGQYTIVPRSKAELEFLALGEGAAQWLREAAANGVKRIPAKMAEAVDLGKMVAPDVVDRALWTAAVHHRFATGDLASLIYADNHDGARHAPGEASSLTQGTSSWANLGTTTIQDAAR